MNYELVYALLVVFICIGIGYIIPKLLEGDIDQIEFEPWEEQIMNIVVVYIALVLAIGLCCLFIGIHLETVYFNKGICPVCNGKYEIFDIDSQGSRGYECDACGNVIWVSYPCVDK